jgi:hypothetical protein
MKLKVAYKFVFELNAPAEIHRTLYYAGAGEECSYGYGMGGGYGIGGMDGMDGQVDGLLRN